MIEDLTLVSCLYKSGYMTLSFKRRKQNTGYDFRATWSFYVYFINSFFCQICFAVTSYDTLSSLDWQYAWISNIFINSLTYIYRIHIYSIYIYLQGVQVISIIILIMSFSWVNFSLVRTVLVAQNEGHIVILISKKIELQPDLINMIVFFWHPVNVTCPVHATI